MIQGLGNIKDKMKGSSNVPTTADLVIILQKSLEAVNNIVSFIDSSQLKNPKMITLKIRRATESTISAISYMSSCITRISMEMQKLNTIKSLNDVNSIITNPASFVKAIKSGKTIDEAQRTPIEEYLNLLTIVNKMSEIKVNFGGIIKSSIGLRLAISKLLGINKYLNRKARHLQPLSQLATSWLMQIPSTWNLLSGAQQSLDSFYQQSSKVNYIKLWWGVRKLFSVYYLLLGNTSELWGFIAGKRKTALKIKLFGKTYGFKSHLSGIVQTAKQIIAFNALVKQYNEILNTSVTLFSSLMTIGKMSKRTLANGINNFSNMLVGLKEVIAGRSSLTSKQKKKIGTIIPLLGIYVAITSLASVVAQNIIFLGQSGKLIKKGLLVFALLFNDKKGKKILGFQTKIGATESLMSILQGIDTKKSTVNKLLDVIKITSLMTLAMMTILPTCMSLAMIGGYRRAIKRGVNAVRFAIDKMIEILIENKKVKKLNYKTIWDRISTVILMTGMFVVVAGEIAIIGVMAPAIVLSAISVVAIGFVITTLIGILYFLGRKSIKKTIKEGLPGLVLAKQGINMMLEIALEAGKLGVLDIPKLLLAVVGVTMTIMVFTGVAAFLSIKKVKKSIAQGSLTLAQMNAVFIPLMKQLTDLIKGTDYRSMLALAVAASSTLMVLVLGILGVGKVTVKFKKQVIEGTATFGAIAAMAILIRGVASQLGEASKVEINFINLAKLAGAIVLIVGVAVVVGLATAPLALAMIGIIALGIVMLQLLVVVSVLKVIALFDPNNLDTARANINTIFNVCKDIITSAPSDPMAIVTMGVAMVTIGLITVMTTLMVILALELKAIELINIDKNIITNRIDDIFSCIDYIMFRSVNGTDPTQTGEQKDQSKFGRFITKTCSQVADVITALFTMGSLVVSFITVSALLLIAGALRMIQEINLDPVAIGTKVQSIFNCLNILQQELSQSKDLRNNSEDKGWFQKVLSKIPIVGDVLDIVDALADMGSVAMSLITVGMITLIAKNLDYIANIKFDETGVTKKVEDIFTITNSVINKIKSLDIKSLNYGDSNKVEDVTDTMKELGEAIEIINLSDPTKYSQNVDSTIKLIDKANSINTDKIKSVAEMFERMAGFSKTINGNFEKLAKVLSEDLMDALGELNQYLENASNNEMRQPSQASPMFTNASGQPITMMTTPMEAIKQQPFTNTPAQALPDLSTIQSSLTRIQDTLSSFTTSGVVIKETDF